VSATHLAHASLLPPKAAVMVSSRAPRNVMMPRSVVIRVHVCSRLGLSALLQTSAAPTSASTSPPRLCVTMEKASANVASVQQGSACASIQPAAEHSPRTSPRVPSVQPLPAIYKPRAPRAASMSTTVTASLAAPSPRASTSRCLKGRRATLRQTAHPKHQRYWACVCSMAVVR